MKKCSICRTETETHTITIPTKTHVIDTCNLCFDCSILLLDFISISNADEVMRALRYEVHQATSKLKEVK